MLLESALLEFSTDESDVFEDAVQHSSVGFDWETLGKSKVLAQNGGSGSNSDAVAGPADIKHVYLDRKLLNSRQPPGEFSAVRQSKLLSDFLGMSRSPPAVDVNCSPTFEISGSDDVPVHDEKRSRGMEGHSGSHKTQINGRSIKSGADENILRRNMALAGKTAVVPFVWEAQAGKSKLQRGSSPNQDTQLQMPSNRSITLPKNGKGVYSSSTSSQKKDYKTEREQPEQQRGRPSYSPNARGVSPIRQSTRVRSSSGDGKQIKRPDSVEGPGVLSRLENHLKRSDPDLLENSMNSKYKYYEDESPVSILVRPPSPPTTNSSGSSGSSVHSPPRPAAAPPLGIARRRPSGFSSPSAQESPRASTSSSTRYMGQCLVALQAALAIDPEKSKRFEDSFVELDTYVEGDLTRTNFKSPSDDDDDDDDDEEDDDLFNHNAKVRRSPVWARGAAVPRSDMEPEYNTMDFYSDSDEEIVGQQSHISPASSVASLARSSSGSSISGPIRRSLNYHRPMRVDNYSSKDRRFLSSHPSSWVEHGDDSISSSLTNSKCNTLTRHQDIPWDEQQADLDSVRAEEVIRGAIDGLRFTYSPVSSAFVFTRSNEDDEAGAASGRNDYGNSPLNKTFTDYEASRRFSISLDYDASIRSEDSMSFARGSDVTELGMSRAESWSKVARGIALQHGYQDAIPSSFIRRAGNAPMYEQANASSSSPAFNPGGGLGDGTPDSRIVRKQRCAKKSGITTCLPFRAILRNFRTLGSPGRSRLGLAPGDTDRTPPNRLTL